MNYNQPYQGFYGNTSYQNPYSGGMQQIQNPYVQYQQPQLSSTPLQNNTQMLNCKFVDGIDVARATEVPIGQNGIFPKTDLSEVYVKTWLNNGTTKMLTFKLETNDEINGVNECANNNVFINDILTQLGDLNKKIDKLSNELGA